MLLRVAYGTPIRFFESEQFALAVDDVQQRRPTRFVGNLSEFQGLPDAWNERVPVKRDLANGVVEFI